MAKHKNGTIEHIYIEKFYRNWILFDTPRDYKGNVKIATTYHLKSSQIEISNFGEIKFIKGDFIYLG